MKNKRFTFIAILLIAIMIGNISNQSAKVYASTAKYETAKKEYLKFLQNKDYEAYFDGLSEFNWDGSYSFMLLDIDQNGVPELLISQDTEFSYIYIFTYSNKKIKEVGNLYSYAGLNYNKKTKTLSYYVVRPSYSSEDISILTYKNNKLSEQMNLFYDSGEYYIDGKIETEAKYTAAYKKYRGTYVSFIKITDSNQKLLLQNKLTINLTKKSTETISLDSQFADKVTFKSNKPSVATVDKYGEITAKNTGTAIITATVKHSKYTEKYTITVKVK